MPRVLREQKGDPRCLSVILENIIRKTPDGRPDHIGLFRFFLKVWAFTLRFDAPAEL